jgi:FkbM family methyltransferase
MRRPLVAAASWLAGRLPTWALLALYRLGPLTHLLRRLLNQSVPIGINPVTVAGGHLAGARLMLDLREEKDLWLGSYEPSVLEAVERWVRPGMTVYDVGAHIGYVTLALAQAVGAEGRVVAFEPLPANQQRLRANLELNGLSGRVEVLPAAVGESSGSRWFQPHASVAMGRLVAEQEAPPGSFQVEVVALDDFGRGQSAWPGLIKIDIEGGEVAALRGMRQILRAAGPVLLLEVHGAQAAQAVAEELQAAGYRLSRLRRGLSRMAWAGQLGGRGHILALPPADSSSAAGSGAVRQPAQERGER